MEELADAIEDAQYVNAISTQDDGPRPVLPWNKPTEEELAAWEEKVKARQAKINDSIGANNKEKPAESAPGNALAQALKIDSAGVNRTGMKCEAFTLEWVCQHPIGYFLFSQFIKETAKDYLRINFCEEVLRYRKTRGRHNRLKKAVKIAKLFLMASASAPPEKSRELTTDDKTIEKSEDIDASVMRPSIDPNDIPPKTEINEYDLYRKSSSCANLTPQEIKAMYTVNMDYPHCTESLVGVKGPVRDEIYEKIRKLEELYPDVTEKVEKRVREQRESAKTNSEFISQAERSHHSRERAASRRNGVSNADDEEFAAVEANGGSSPTKENKLSMMADAKRGGQLSSSLSSNKLNNSFDDSAPMQGLQRATSAAVMSPKAHLSQSSTGRMLNSLSTKIEQTPRAPPHNLNLLVPVDMFDKAETIVMESLRNEYWKPFVESPHYTKLKHFLWYQDRRVEPDDFLTMRVLGRGGFGLVYACKKGTSGKLYAMKVMNKRRIKMKKSETLCLNERKALEAVNSKFVVNLNYAFHSKDDVYLILDLMTGGDLGYHLHRKRHFRKEECLYFAARIMLGLQALHDENYVYRDLKPENCLLGEDGRVKITDLGLATKIKPDLHGAAGTRGYWAPEMLRRDSNGKRMAYGHAVDWFSFGCCVAEFISGTNPFRSEAALNFGLERGKQTKEKAIDCATLEMDPILPPEKFEKDAADLCRRLLDKNEKTRLGYNGCQEIMAHPWFKSVNWDRIITDREQPPYTPPKDINAASREEISTFPEDKAYQETVITEKDESLYDRWDWLNPGAFAAEVIEVLIYERDVGPLVPLAQHGSCCCAIL